MVETHKTALPLSSTHHFPATSSFH